MADTRPGTMALGTMALGTMALGTMALGTMALVYNFITPLGIVIIVVPSRHLSRHCNTCLLHQQALWFHHDIGPDTVTLVCYTISG